MNNNSKTIVAFQIGAIRGGRSHGPGRLSFIGEHRIGEFTEDLFPRHENLHKFEKRFGFDNTFGSDQKCIIDLINDEDFDELEEKFGITEEMLGQIMYYDEGGNSTELSQEDVDSGIGTIQVDNGKCDAIYTKYLSDCSDSEIRAIQQSDYWNKDELLRALGIEEEEEEE